MCVGEYVCVGGCMCVGVVGGCVGVKERERETSEVGLMPDAK